MKTYANINGQQVDMSGVTGNRDFREAWSGVDSENVVTYDLAAVKTIAKGKINEWREAQKVLPFTIDGLGEFSADVDSKTNIDGASQAALMAAVSQTAFSIDWSLHDGTVVTLDGAAMMGVGQTLLAHINAAHIAARVKQSDLEAAVDMAEVQTVLDSLDA